jgi:uncharacterized FlaG/YvyC family protein
MNINGSETAVQLPRQGVLPLRAEQSVRAPQSRAKPVAADVPSDVPAEVPSGAKPDRPTAVETEQAAIAQTEKSAEKAKGRSEESAAKLAARLEQAINDAFGTSVRFSVSPREEGPDSVSFQIIEKESGEVLREFPEDEVRQLVTREDIQTGQGIFVEAAA